MSNIEYTSIHTFMLNYFNLDYMLSVILFNIYTYIFLITQIFLIFFMFDTTYFRTINELKFFGDIKNTMSSILLTFLSLAGIPPLLGFCSKFILFILLFEKINLLFIIIFSFFNLFGMFFYIQNFRFLSSNKSYKNISVIPTRSKNSFFYDFIFLFQFINLFGIFFFEEFLIYLNSMVVLI